MYICFFIFAFCICAHADRGGHVAANESGTRLQFSRQKPTEETPTDRSAGVLVWCSIR